MRIWAAVFRSIITHNDKYGRDGKKKKKTTKLQYNMCGATTPRRRRRSSIKKHSSGSEFLTVRNPWRRRPSPRRQTIRFLFFWIMTVTMDECHYNVSFFLLPIPSANHFSFFFLPKTTGRISGIRGDFRVGVLFFSFFSDQFTFNCRLCWNAVELSTNSDGFLIVRHCLGFFFCWFLFGYFP